MNKDSGSLIVIGLLLWFILKGQQSPQVSNEETWEWVDWQGRKRSITVHRNVSG